MGFQVPVSLILRLSFGPEEAVQLPVFYPCPVHEGHSHHHPLLKGDFHEGFVKRSQERSIRDAKPSAVLSPPPSAGSAAPPRASSKFGWLRGSHRP